MKKIIILIIALTILCTYSSCDESGGINIFSIQDDIELGAQLKAEIQANPTEYPILPRIGNEQAYAYLDAMRDRILASNELHHKEDFTWELTIIQDDNTLNAFCAPGGYIYVYTGLIKYLDEADHLAGVLAHEIAHADQRHSTQQLTQTYGVSTLASMLLGENPGLLAEIAQNLVSLSFSRADEKDADEHSVDYLCDTDYASDGAAGFFEKLINTGQTSGTPAFLSTHPNPDNRVSSIQERAVTNNCAINLLPNAEYAAFKSLLP